MTRTGTPALAVLALSAAVLGGCAGSTVRPASPGSRLFTTDCSACHSLSGHEDPRRQGGDLLGFHSSRTALVQLTREMPVRHPLSPSGLQAVVDYVMEVERRGHQ